MHVLPSIQQPDIKHLHVLDPGLDANKDAINQITLYPHHSEAEPRVYKIKGDKSNQSRKVIAIIY